MRVAIFGAGAVGSFLGARLALSGTDVVVFARGSQADTIASAGGILLKDSHGERRAKVTLARSAESAGPVDAVFVTTKGHHHADAARAIAPLLTRDQPVVFAANGIPWWYGLNVALPGVTPDNDPALATLDPDGDLRRIVGVERAVGCVVHSPNSVDAPGTVSNKMEPNRFLLGAVDPARQATLKPLVAAIEAAGIVSAIDAPIRTVIWRKLMYTMCMGPIAALTGLRNGQIRSDPDLQTMLAGMSQEGVALAAAHGSTVSGEFQIPATGPIAQHKQSMLQDVEKGARVEFHPIVSVPRAYAHAAGLPCPYLDAVATLLHGKLMGLEQL